MSRNGVVERQSGCAGGCNSLIAAGEVDASSPKPAGKSAGVSFFSRDQGVATPFCGEAPRPLFSPIKSLRLRQRHSKMRHCVSQNGVLPLKSPRKTLWHRFC
jgi:hypothetical protein